MKQILVGMIAVIFTCGAFHGGTAWSQEKPTVLKLAHINVAGGMLDKHALKFAELVAAKTKGRARVDVYPAGQLGNMTEMMEGVSMGSIPMCLESETMYMMFDKDYSVTAVPFLITKEMVSTNDYMKELRERVRVKNNIRTLPGLGFRPPFHLWTQKRAVRTPDEFQGMKIRLVQQKIQIESWNGLGATAVAVPWGELYMALAQGVVNGMAHNINQVEEEKFYEQLNYCTLLEAMLVWQTVLINDKAYAGLTPDIQKAINESAAEAATYFNGLASSLEGEAKKKLEKHGIKFIQADRNIWYKKAVTVMQKLENDGAWAKGLLKKFGVN
jgi:TRAP-type C4-dicarboxylate transport system substrate-binding protein